jgi:hypothetical protein
LYEIRDRLIDQNTKPNHRDFASKSLIVQDVPLQHLGSTASQPLPAALRPQFLQGFLSLSAGRCQIAKPQDKKSSLLKRGCNAFT